MATVGLFVSQKDNWANGVLDNEYEFINAENNKTAYTNCKTIRKPSGRRNRGKCCRQLSVVYY